MKSTILICAAICSIFSVLSPAQSRRVTPVSGEQTKKVNERKPSLTPLPTPTPTPEEADENAVTDDSDVITVATELVTIPVKVLDRSGRFVGGLTKESFTVLEDNVPQEIAYFSNEQQPFTVALVLDMSYSAKFKAEEIQAAALSFINQLRPNDRVMIVSFDEEIFVNSEPTNDRRRLQSAIKQTKISTGTSLYDAMSLVFEKFKKIDGRKAIVLFSDGVDTTSKKSADFSNLRDALELDSLIYPIQYDTYYEVQAMKNQKVTVPPGKSPVPGRDDKNPFPFPFPTSGGIGGGGSGTFGDKGTTREEYQRADEYLNELANRTGGRLYPAATTANLTAAFTNIASELRAYYSLGFYPKEGAVPGTKHKIKVKIDKPGFAVKARSSYSVKNNEKAKK
ncbi:MAG: VWA domain-containing protein [Acidobacteria bacterium]|nr:VWA domain-containing protein [Acidobacteriota bacterium]